MKPVDFRNRINNTKHTPRLEAMISGANPCFPNIGSQLGLQMHGGGGGSNTGISTDSPEIDPTISSLLQGTRSLSSVNYGHTDVDHGRHHEYHLSSLFDSLSVIKDKVHQIQSLLNFLMSPTTSHPYTDHHQHHQQQENHGDQQQLPNQPVSSSFLTSSSIGLASNMGMLIQEIVVTASSMLFSCQQISLSTGPSAATITTPTENNAARQSHQLISSSGCTAATMIAIATAAVAAPGDRGAPYLGSFNQGTTGHDNIYWRTDSHNHIPSLSYHNCNGGSGNDDDNYPNCMSASMFDDDSKLIIDTTSGAAKQNTQPAEKLCPPRSSDSLLSQNPRLPPSSSSMLRDNGYDIVEVDAEDLLAKYTHFCRVCGKGFKRDANLRMHMRAHGDEYKSNAALINPLKKMKSLISDSAAPTTAATPEGDANHNNNSSNYNYYYKDHGSSSKMVYSSPSIDQLPSVPRKVYSCPQEGCRWNKKHAKFQPLKSMICVKNHYKRSHCPKMYVCKRCNRKQFSVLSDLKTHEKHCGDRRWQCSCGTTFSRKDKLMGHVALFLGHTPMVPNTLVQPQATKPT